jgi:hypothetical protein
VRLSEDEVHIVTVHDYCLWNLHAEGRIATFQVTVPAFDTMPLSPAGDWLSECLAAIGAAPAGSAKVTRARWWYSGDYSDSSNWEDRWAPVSFVEVPLDREVHFAKLDTVAFEDRLGHLLDAQALDAYHIDGVEPDDPQHAVLIVDCPHHLVLSSESLDSLRGDGTLVVQTKEHPPEYTKLADMKRIVVVRAARFPEDVGTLERTLQSLPTPASFEWQKTFHPRNE